MSDIFLFGKIPRPLLWVSLLAKCLPKEVMKWHPPARGRPKLTWAEVIRGLIGGKGLLEEMTDTTGGRR
jgi:hypothetical protein